MKIGVTEEHYHEVEERLKLAGLNYLRLEYQTDFILEENRRIYRVFWSTIATKDKKVYDAWIILGDGQTNVCHYDKFPNIKSAIANHVGNLVLGGYLKVIPTVPDDPG